MKRIYKIIIFSYIIAGSYTIFRYHIFGDVLWKDFPVFTLNKIIIFSALLMLMFAKLLKISAADKNKIVEFFKFSIALHILLSLLIMKPYYVKEFFTDEHSLSFAGNLSRVC